MEASINQGYNFFSFDCRCDSESCWFSFTICLLVDAQRIKSCCENGFFSSFIILVELDMITD
jgi:hypothetical protein